jgi:hypothetical protein
VHEMPPALATFPPAVAIPYLPGQSTRKFTLAHQSWCYHGGKPSRILTENQHDYLAIKAFRNLPRTRNALNPSVTGQRKTPASPPPRPPRHPSCITKPLSISRSRRIS